VHLGGAEDVTRRVKPIACCGDHAEGRLKRRICVVVASEMTVRAFLVRQLRAMQSEYDVTVVVNTANLALLRDLGIEGRLAAIAIERRVSIRRDVVALWSLYWLMRNGRFDLVHSMTPKAGLLAMAAAWMTRVPVRIHTFTGQVWAARRGVSRWFLRLCDVLIARMATDTLADSPSQREFLVGEGVASMSAIGVLGKGSVGGVDLATFKPDSTVRNTIRPLLGVRSEYEVVLLFVGRLTRDKGLLDLARAFRLVADERSEVRLVIVGPDEESLRPAILSACGAHVDRVQFFEETDRPQDFMAAADVLCLPSYREGIGVVIIEAAACGVPAVASRIYGIVDAVDEGRTGLLHPPGDVPALATELRHIVRDGELRRSLGSAARGHVEREFTVDRMVAAHLSFYAELLNRTHFRNDVDVRRDWYGRFGKRTFDVTVASSALLLLLPLLAAISAIVRIAIGRPVLFRHRRPGLNGYPFTLVKFRSLTDRYDDQGRPLPDADRLTRVGSVLRGSSLDELPELWNVLKGDMSLVGPRPLLMEYLPRYSPRQAKRHAVRPGITGLAQVNGRNELAWEERFEFDLFYAEHISVWLDLRILARTVWLVIAGRGISQPGQATAQEFRGAEGQ
jgi:lipopolysaccharide/colanic/teichoic acid biosynthesis glycosyltransferase/glycosyltransferase involved in cell wall biosynthesis